MNPVSQAAQMNDWWNERSVGAKIAVVGGALLIVMAAIGGLGSSDDDTTAAAADSTSTTATPTTLPGSTSTTEPPAEPSTTSSTTTTTAPTTTTTTDPMAAFRFDPVEVSGSGDDVVDLAIPEDLPAVVTFTHDGSSNFAVISHTEDNERIDLLVNTIGDYTGQRPINLYEGEDVGFLEVTADGPWTARAIPLSDIDTFDATASGTGDTVLFVTSDGGRLAATHAGESNFVVLAHGGSRDLLVNEIGTYDGTVLLGGDALVLEVQADGDWTLDLE